MQEDSTDMLLCSSRIVTPEGILSGGLLIRDGLIVEVVEQVNIDRYSRLQRSILDFGDHYILPGVIDGHVHVNEPGRTEWEGIASATRAAAAGGITTIIDMPLNSSPVTVSREALELKQKTVSGKCWVDVGFHGGAVGHPSLTWSGTELARNVESLIDGGVVGLKVFLCDSGLEEFPPVTLRELEIIMPILAKRNIPLWVHAEMVPSEWKSPEQINRYPEWPIARSRSFESMAISAMIALCSKYNCATHIVHLSNADAIPAIRRAKRERVPITVETCPHYLYFASEKIPDQDPRYKCCPPIRELENRNRLWQALELGEIDTIGSDHSPCPPELKCLSTGDFARAWGGIASLQLMLSVMWQQANYFEMPIMRLVECLSSAPAKLLGIESRKGSIEVGKFADLVVFDPDTNWTVSGKDLYHRHPVTPYEGVELQGRVAMTLVRGRVVYQENEVAEMPTGQLIERS
jgi:allantoinase